MMPTVSVIIPTYNRASRLVEAISSVMSQTLRDFEIIVVDDGSSDNTREILTAKFGQTFQYISKKHAGFPQRNSGIEQTSGKYIAFLDSDDLWVPDKLERQVGLMETSTADTGLVYCDCTVENHHRAGLCKRFRAGCNVRGHVFKEALLGKLMVSPSRVLVKRECLKAVGGFKEGRHRSEDTELWIRIARRYRVDFVDAPLVIKRHLGNNMMTDLTLLEDPVWLLRAVFDAPGCPKEIMRLKNQAYAIRWLHTISAYYKCGNVRGVWKCFLRALLLHPPSICPLHLRMLVRSPLQGLMWR